MSEDSAPAHSGVQSTLSAMWPNPYYRRWVGWVALSLAFLLMGHHRTSMGALAEVLVRSFATTGTELGLLHSSFFLKQGESPAVHGGA